MCPADQVGKILLSDCDLVDDKGKRIVEPAYVEEMSRDLLPNAAKALFKLMKDRE